MFRKIIHQYDIDYILPLISKTGILIYKDYKISLGTSRIRLFKQRQLICVGCKLKAETFYLEQTGSSWNSNKVPILNLYGKKGTEEICFTRDHILPVARGGTDRFDNLQIMCEKCNFIKSTMSNEEFFNLINKKDNNEDYNFKWDSWIWEINLC